MSDPSCSQTGRPHDYLCKQCQTFDLTVESFITHRNVQQPHLPGIRLDLGGRDEVIARSDACSLCWLFTHCLDLKVNLYARRPGLICRLLWTTDYDELGTGPQNHGRVAYYLKPTMQSDISMEQMNTARCRIMLCGDDLMARNALSSFFTARTPAPTQLCFGLIRCWLAYCSDSHTDCERMRPIAQAHVQSHNTIMVIDVQRKCLVDIAASDRYFALSYVWGKDATFQTLKDNVEELRQPGGLTRIWHMLPKTITDAMEVMAALSEPYLWCDRLCIVQDDAQSKHALISRTDQVYGSAWAVIIARSGEHAEAGLFGQNPLHKAKRLSHAMQLVAVPEFRPNTVSAVTPLEGRAWT